VAVASDAVPAGRFTSFEHQAMARALELAGRGRCSTHPNPRVGCVLVADGRIVGEGWHERAGEPHAETFALRAAGAKARGATAFVTLEPCNHHGRTPPCTEALLAAGVTRVIYAVADPNPRVDGSGAARLRAAGVEVRDGLMAAEAEQLNLGFFSRMRRGRPWLRLKLAASLDGRTALANGESRWITSAAAREDVQVWRAESAAILSSSGTVLADDPALTVRSGPEPRRQPLRVILDSRLRVPADARVFREPGATVRLAVRDARRGDEPVAARLDAAGNATARVEFLEAGADGRVSLRAALAWMGQHGLNEGWVEAGPTLAGALLREGLVDELVLYLAPTLLGPDARPLALWPSLEKLADAPRWRIHDLRMIGTDARMMLRQGDE
jgi:diaminohydroxyphosphoribosylaminopyrimidine deaminase/5-amino-6-(5-phosphoribosylamino)uracil reductase